MPSKRRMNTDEHVAQYSKVRSRYENFAAKLEALLCDLLAAHPVKHHVVESRAKSIESFREKITRPGKSYSDPFKELTDLAGIRVIVYYTDDVDTVASILKKEFRVHPDKSSDKRDMHDADQFGYLSVHRILSLKTPRSYLAEWKPFVKLQFEVQIRTVLQHSWAAISHAMQYKQKADVPDSLKRKLFRLAGLFELADEQFVDIRDRHADITKTVARKFDSESKDILIDSVSMQEFVNRSKQLDEIAKAAVQEGLVLKDQSARDYVGRLVEECSRLGVSTVDELELAVLRLGGRYLKFFAKARNPDDIIWKVGRPFLLYIILIAAFRDKFTVEYLVTNDLWDKDIATRVLDAAAAIE